MVSNRRTGSTQVHTITSAATPLGDDIAKRAHRYLLQMGLRTLCFIGAVATWDRVPTWISVSLLVGAVILPYVAVVLANAGRERPERPDEFTHVRALGAGPTDELRYGPGPYGGVTFESTVVDPFLPDAGAPVVTPAPVRGQAPDRTGSGTPSRDDTRG